MIYFLAIIAENLCSIANLQSLFASEQLAKLEMSLGYFQSLGRTTISSSTLLLRCNWTLISIIFWGKIHLFIISSHQLSHVISLRLLSLFCFSLLKVSGTKLNEFFHCQMDATLVMYILLRRDCSSFVFCIPVHVLVLLSHVR
jgi:hypothetical protein